MADKMEIKAPSVEQNINVNVTGGAEIHRLYTELQAALEQIDKVNSTLQSTESELDNVRAQFDNFAHGKGIDILQEELQRFKYTAEQSVEEFRAFLQSVNLNDSFGNNDRQFSDLFERIRDGSMTTSQAILRVKTDMRALMEENYQGSGGVFDAQMVQSFTAALEHLGSTISTVVERLNSIEQNGVKSIGGTGGTEVANVLGQIESAARGMTEEVKGSYESITALVTAMNEYANLDSTKLLGVSQAFRNIADIGKGSFGTKSIDNIIHLATQLQALSQSGASLRFDFTGLNGLKVSKASLNNLATYLPEIAKVDASRLNAISKVDFSNFNNLKVNKGSLDSIAQFTAAIQTLKEAMSTVEHASAQMNIGVSPSSTGAVSGSFDGIVSGAGQAAIAIDKIKASISEGNLSAITKALKGIDSIDGSSANRIAESLSNLGVTISKVTPEVETLKDGAQKLVTLTVNGRDSNNNTIQYLLKFDKETQEVTRTVMKAGLVVEQVATNAREAVKQVSDAAAAQPIGKTIGDNLTTKQTQLDTFITKLKELSIKAEEYNASINHSLVYSDDGSIVSNPVTDGNSRSAIDSINALIDAVQRYRNSLTGDTETKAFNDNLSRFRTEAESIRTAVDSAEKSTKNFHKSEKESLNDTNALSKAVVATNRAYKQATEAVQKYTAAKKGRSSREYAELEESATQLKLLDDRLRAGTISEKEYTQETNKLRAAIQRATATIKANGEAHLSLGDKIKAAAAKFTQYFSVTRIVLTAWRAVNRLVSSSIALDTAFTQLKIVTGATDEEMKEFSNTAIELSKNLGQSVADVAKSIETFSRLGYSLPDASKLSEYATILANTAAVSTDEATTGLTSIIKGFNMDVSEAEHVADVLIDVGQKYAVSAGEMMEAYARSGAALKATNVSFEKSAGLIAAANASIQDSSVVGTALKTVSARIRGSKSDLEELGEDTAELADGFSKYADEIKALTGFNIMVEGSTTEFKDLYDIFEGVAQAWENLSDTSQARVAEILGGTRQLQVISSIIGNWKDAAGAYETAMNSAGVATQANATYMESAQAHINQFKATFEELSADIMSSDLIKFFVDFATTILGAVDAITKLIGSMGSLPALAATISAALSFKNVGELIKQFRFPIILRIEYAHEALN